MVQIRHMAFRPMIFQFKTYAALMDDFQVQVRADFHLVELAADVIAVNHGRPPPLSGYKKGAPRLGERLYFVVF